MHISKKTSSRVSKEYHWRRDSWYIGLRRLGTDLKITALVARDPE
jgi:hypothetical protein